MGKLWLVKKVKSIQGVFLCPILLSSVLTRKAWNLGGFRHVSRSQTKGIETMNSHGSFQKWLSRRSWSSSFSLVNTFWESTLAQRLGYWKAMTNRGNSLGLITIYCSLSLSFRCPTGVALVLLRNRSSAKKEWHNWHKERSKGPKTRSYLIASLFLVANLVPSSKARSPDRSVRSLLVAMPFCS